MSHYIDIRLLSDPEFPAHQLMAALFAKLHRQLVRVQASSIGVSFPGYATKPATLGSVLRLIGPDADLTRLMAHDWMSGMRDHANVDAMSAVPADAVHRSLRRVQAKSNPERLRRRQMRRHGLTAEQAREKIPDDAAETLDLPFVRLASTSTGQIFLLHLRLGTVEPFAVPGTFNTFGLSASATIPCF